MSLELISNPTRIFQYDYIYIDAIFLLIWIGFLLWNKKYKALMFGLIIAPIIYYIDAQIWWNTLLQGNTFMREYWVGGVQIPHPLGNYSFSKLGIDFMMNISYALYTFPWIWIMFENLKKTNCKEVFKYTLLFFTLWVFVPLFSILLPLNNTIVEAVRHMHAQLNFWMLNVFVGYTLLLIVYRKNLQIVLKVFLVGLIGSLIMEIPLYLFNIRQTATVFILFEALFLLNQGVPYLYLFWDKVLSKINFSSITHK